jgi:predicted O-methyltransferase YrrM
MVGWEDINTRREKLPSSVWWKQENVLFSYKFRFPVECNTLFIVIGGNREIKFVEEKVERIISFQKNADVYLLVENPKLHGGLLSLTSNTENANKIKAVPLTTPLSVSIEDAIAKKILPGMADCTIILSPRYGYDNLAYVRQIPLCSAMRKISNTVLTLDNHNYLTKDNDPLEDIHQVRGNKIYGFASLTAEDMEFLFDFAGEAAGGVIVEIGRFLGGSTSIIAKSIKESGKPSRFYSFDPLLPETVHAILEKNKLTEYADLHAMTSKEALIEWQKIGNGSKIDFLFIDADHRYEGIMHDLTAWTPMVKKGGVIMVHDYCFLFHNELEDVDVAVYKTLMNGNFKALGSCLASVAYRKK